MIPLCEAMALSVFLFLRLLSTSGLYGSKEPSFTVGVQVEQNMLKKVLLSSVLVIALQLFYQSQMFYLTIKELVNGDVC